MTYSESMPTGWPSEHTDHMHGQAAPVVAHVVIPAAGSGQRLGGGEPKALRRIGDRSLLRRCVDVFAAREDIGMIVAVVPADRVAEVDDDLNGRSDASVAAHVADDGNNSLHASVRVVAGGASRQESVATGLAALPDDGVPYVLVHDAARPLVPGAVVDRVVEALRAGDEAVVPGLPVVDTIKVVDESGIVVGTPPRDQLRAVQTPQGFARATLSAAHAQAVQAGIDATDDAGLIERLGGFVRVVPGDPLAGKITTVEDLAAMTTVAQRLEGTDSEPRSVASGTSEREELP